MRRPACLAFAAVTAGLAISACGSSSHAASSRGSIAAAGAIKYADCMRTHGVPSFPDPSSGGGLRIPNNVDPASPAFQTAQNACQSVMPGGPGARSPATAQQKSMLLRLARCMRDHGVSGFPDPVSSPPANPAGFTMAFGRPGAFIVVPETLKPQSPLFEQAAQACQFPGFRRASGTPAP